MPPVDAHAAGHRLELADIFRTYGAAYRASHPLPRQHLRAMRAIEACRTPALGSQTAVCDQGAGVVVRYHSCRNRHCPKCQTLAKVRWVDARTAELLPVPYFHCVFTLPHTLNPVAQGNPQVCYALVFRSAAATMQTFGRDPKWLGGELGITMVLHTWSQTLEPPLHVHCIVTGGAWDADANQWSATKRRDFLFPVRALSKVFRAKYLAGLHDAFTQQRLQFGGATAPLAEARTFEPWLDRVHAHDWIVYAKPPFAGPRQVVSYLGRSTHRVALSNERLVALKDHQGLFQWRDSRHGARAKTMALAAPEFLRRFLLHVLPVGFVRIRHYGVLGNRDRSTRLGSCRTILKMERPALQPAESTPALMKRLTGIDIEQCPHCRQGRLRVIATVYGPRHPSGPTADDGATLGDWLGSGPSCPLSPCPIGQGNRTRACVARVLGGWRGARPRYGTVV